MLSDGFNRSFKYLRLALGQACNFRCQYCLPNGCGTTFANSELTKEEVIRLIEAFKELGISKVRLTGGEPTLRTDLLSIARRIKYDLGIEQLVMTTNGYNLDKKIKKYHDAGFDGLNISIDTLKKEKFKQITGKDCLKSILDGISEGINLGFKSIKVNSVLHRTFHKEQIEEFQEWVKPRPISVRFIELMQTQDNLEYFQKEHIRASSVEPIIASSGWCENKSKSLTDGPARIFSQKNYLGKIGFIDPYAAHFCDGCNRLRVTSMGELRLCLFGDKNYSLRHLLQSQNQKSELTEKVASLLGLKKEKHFLHEGNYGTTKNLAQTGG